MTDFFMKSRYPVITFFLKDGKYGANQHSPDQKDNTTWNVPLLVWDAKTQKVNPIWILNDSSICTNDGFELNPQNTYIFNYGAYSFARVRYSPELFNRLLLMNSNLIDTPTQLGLYYDQMDEDKEKSIKFNRFKPEKGSPHGKLIKKFIGDLKSSASPHIIGRVAKNKQTENFLFLLR
jgi:hypothetical protein